MRWEQLFGDLEAQADAADRDELAGEVADRTRRELALVTVEDRMRASVGTPVEVGLAGGHRVSGVIREVGSGWLWLDHATGPALVVTAAICELVGLGAAVAPPLNEVDARLRLPHVLRAVAQDRRRCAVGLTDGRVVRGVLTRVGRDFVDLIDRQTLAPTRTSAGPRTVALAALAVVR